MKKFLVIAILSSLVSISTQADDLLYEVTNGVLSDNSPGVKVLSLEEQKQVKGGYITSFKALSSDEIVAIARVTINADAAGVDFGKLRGNEIIYDANGNFDVSKSSICGIDTTSCFMFNDTQKPFWQNEKRLQEYKQVAGDLVLYSIGYC